MKKDKSIRHVVDSLFVIALLFLFAISALMLIALGSSIYRRSVNIMQSNYDSRTAYAYITEKLRQHDDMGNISVVHMFGQDAIRIDSKIDETEYVTFLYEYEGSLMELMARADVGNFPPKQGQEIIEIDSLNVAKKDDAILEITVVLPDETEINFTAAQRSAKDE